jgi:hypothetical protein
MLLVPSSFVSKVRYRKALIVGLTRSRPFFANRGHTIIGLNLVGRRNMGGNSRGQYPPLVRPQEGL